MEKKKISDYLKFISLEDAFEWSGDWTSAILHDEFSRVYPPLQKEKKDYRERGIDRLIEMRVPWGENGNISWEINKRYMRVVCPYCSSEMKWNGSSGAMYKCGCGAVANPSGSFYFTPPKDS